MSDTQQRSAPDTQTLGEKAESIASEAPVLTKTAIEAIFRKHNPDFKGSAQSAGRVGLQSGNVSELTSIGTLKRGGADNLRRILNLTGGNMDGAERVSTLHDMRFVFLNDDKQMLFATAYDGDWDSYINDFATKTPDMMDMLFSNFEGWPGITSPTVKDYIAGTQITAVGWFVANPKVTVVDVRRYQRTEHALNDYLDTMSKMKNLDPASSAALMKLTDAISKPEGVDY